MINFVVISSDLQLYVLDSRAWREAELSTYHQLVVSCYSALCQGCLQEGLFSKCFLNPTNTPFIEQVEAGDSETNLSITQMKVIEVVTNYRKTSLLSLPRNIYAKVLGPKIGLIVRPQIQEEQVFHPSFGTWDQLHTLHRMLEGSWEFSQPVNMCFVDLEMAFNRTPG